MGVLKVIGIVLEVLLIFNLLIFAHELGHFLVAKWRGLKIERFAIWFGKPLWKTTVNGVEYALGWIPAGGYVSLPQMATMEAIEGKSQTPAESLPPISPWDKMLVAFAGPLASFSLAIGFAFVVWWVGRPVSEAETSTVIGYVHKGGPAEAAGLRPGDLVLAVDGHPVTKFSGMGQSIQWRVIRSEDHSIPIVFVRDGVTNRVMVTPTKEPTKFWQRKSLRQILIEPAQPAIIGRVATNSPAARAGLRPGDQIVAVNGQRVFHPGMVSDWIEQHGTNPVHLQVRRSSQTLELTVVPAIPLKPEDNRPRLGVIWSDGGRLTLIYPGPWEQVVDSVGALVSTLEAVVSRKSDIKPQHLGGFVKILTVFYILFQSEEGWRLVLWFSVVLNVNLALLNLLPIPVLDGGHILLGLLEAAWRRPVSARLLHYIQTGCAALLIAYMLYIAFFDVQELPWKRAPVPELIFAPTPGEP